MSSTVVARSRKNKAPAKRRQSWWGSGPPPHKRWPGVTIEIPAVWSRARERWESLDRKFYFDQAAADLACDFFPEFLVHHIGEFAGQSFELMDWQRHLVVRPLFGWKSAATGMRRFRFLFGFIPKGNGKSPLGAGLALFLMLCDGEAGAEVYAVAGDKDQAKIVHESAKVMVEESADLSERCEVLRDSIYAAETRSFCKVLAADAAGAHGFRPHGVIFDELHNQPNRDLFEALRKSILKRRQPMFLMFTHAGDDDESICYEEYEHAKQVLSGTSRDDSFLPVIFEAEAKEDWAKPALWKRVNPGYGVTINPVIFAAECAAALEEPRKRNDFLRFNLNRWTNTATAWLPIEWWDACDGKLPPDSVLAAAPCAIGIDMAQKIDLASANIVFKLPLETQDDYAEVEVTAEDGGDFVKRKHSLNYRIAIVPNFWLPEETLIERAKKDHVPYDQWAASGLLHRTPGAIIDSDSIVREIVTQAPKRFPKLKMAQVGYDPAFATEIAVRLQAAGFTTVEVLQNYTHLSEACQVFEALVKAGRVIHNGHRLLRWNVENVAVRRDDAGRIRPVKSKRVAKRIDGVVATLIALTRLIRLEPAPPEQDYHVDWIR